MSDNLRRSIDSGDESSQNVPQSMTGAHDSTTSDLALDIQALQILDSSDDSIKVLDLDGRVLFIGRGGQALLGIQDVKPFLKTPWVELWQEGNRQAAMDAIAKAKTGEVCTFQSYRLTPSGEPKWWESKVSPMRGADGQVERLLCISRDITQRRQIEEKRKQAEEQSRESDERYQAIINQAVTGVTCTDLDGNVTLVNQKYCDITGYSADELVQLRMQDITHPEDLPRNVELFHRMRSEGTPFEIEKRYIRKDGSIVWVNNSVSVIRDRDGQPQSAVAIVLDITDRKQAEAQRKQLLEREQAAREEAERANRVKDEFLAVLSHELRSPLNPILGWTRLLQTSKVDETRQREALATIERNAKLQTQLIDDLLDISRIIRGKLSLTVAPVNLTFVIMAAVETVRLAAEAKQIQILLDLMTTMSAEHNSKEIAPVSGDAARLQQVVWNLLSNAVKFTPNGGQVTVELRQVNQLAQIRVMDTGKGISPDFLPYVFDYFRQADATTTRKFGGLGLGLAIVKQIVEMHGGTVKAESLGENQGGTFTVQLPILQQTLSPILEPSYAEAAIQETPLSNLQILVVDDDDDTREFQAFLLEQNGARVTAVASGLEALQVLDLFIPDVLVSDVGMAEMDGYMLIQQIRSRPHDRAGMIPAIALTAYAAEVDQQKALQAGFQTHITKPVDSEALLGAIVSLLRSDR